LIINNPNDEEVSKCAVFFPDDQLADMIHAACCLSTGAILITNDHHFDKIKRNGLIRVWSITEAINKLL